MKHKEKRNIQLKLNDIKKEDNRVSSYYIRSVTDTVAHTYYSKSCLAKFGEDTIHVKEIPLTCIK
jgi:hypothetical protein